MTKNPIFSTFLILSTLIILVGILLIIFIQFDRGYVTFDNGSDFFQEQKNLIKHVYQTQVEPEAPQDNPLVMKLNKATVVIQTEPETVPSVEVLDHASSNSSLIEPEQPPAEKITMATYSKPPQSASTPTTVSSIPSVQNMTTTQEAPHQPASDVWQKSQYENDYHMQLLRNNPWSPHYKIGQ